jgi:hypothetical protein
LNGANQTINNINDAVALYQEANQYYSKLNEYMLNPEKVD